ncbi:RHS Repeat [Chryseobacterium nakagawai]|uniref:YD repeat-containing protein n=1 Tax=Chryseobacterium nakagawai TaxID=1241982 RepID=A0AAD0YJ51_CHRNA|nr:hypothetical protein [Chryseobacterium nakagawai]AZA89439.1 hypothetical protein EG343_01740 [Chryseobacterium nakagawai]VEH20798.1 RHS Repeat [Chryseobacterium nakagawai]
MKKYMVTLALLAASMHYSQIGIGNDGGNRPIASPAMASMAKYSDMPVSLASGLPEIGLPLLNVPLVDKGIQYPLSLSYHSDNQIVSDVASGWSFFGTGVIYKKIIDKLDECFDRPDLEGHVNNEFDDLYYYNFPGGSGKFRIKRDVANNTFSLINLTPDHLKIEYTRDNTNLSTFKADGFTITTDNGYKYFFNEFDKGYYKCRSYAGDLPFSYKPAYFLTRIMSPLGREVASMTYDSKYDEFNNIKSSKLKTISTLNGVVELNYTYDEALKTTVNDPYSLQGITVKNLAGETVYSYEFNYSIADKPDKVADRKRMLNYVRKNDKNGQKIEQTAFVYNAGGNLSKIISPTGGTTEYVYENNEKFFNFNDPAYLDYLDRYDYNPDFQYEYSRFTTPLDSEQNLVYSFTIPGDAAKERNYKLFLQVSKYTRPPREEGPGIPGDPNFPSIPIPVEHGLTFKLKRDNVEIRSIKVSTKEFVGKQYEFTNYPGNYTLEIIPVTGTKGSGNFGIIDRAFKPGPYRNAAQATGRRIKNIKFYKNSTDTAPERTINYEYESFDLPNSTSGYEFYSEGDKSNASSSYIIYNNVKVFETGKGYIKNRFLTANDFPKYQSGGDQLYPIYFWPYYRITKQGLPFKKEIYNEQNTLLASEENTYDLDYYSTDEYALNAGSGKIFSKPAYVKKTMNKSTVYYPGGKKMETSSETQFEGISFKPVYSKSEADGDVMEKLMTYPVNLPEYSHLEAAYMVNSPVIVEEKKNGKPVAKAITKFAAPSLLPTSVVSVNSLGESREDMKMEIYNNIGNLVQYRGITGLPVTLIYGYNKSLVIAKIEGATLAEVSPYTADIIRTSNADHATTNSEYLLVQALEVFRKNPAVAKYPVTTYTYDPPIGLTSMTSPSGMKEVYEYDSAGRLKTTKRIDLDANGVEVPKKVSEYQYNYKQ